MKKSKNKTAKKKTGRPKSTGIGAPMVVRMHKPQIKALDAWVGDTGISRPEAIRQLVSWALQHAKTVAAQSGPAINVARERELRR